MSRLTRYEPREYSMFPYQLKDDELSTKLDSIHKLGKLEDLEEDLGCPLEVVFKAIKNGVHIKIDDEEIDIEGWKLSIFIEEQCFIINEMLFRTKLPFSDYGKTWWLKGDRRE